MTAFSLKITTAEEQAAAACEARREAAKMECRRRIFAVADEMAQINLAADAAAGELTDDDLATYRSQNAWVKSMRATWPKLADRGADLTDDANWPMVPQGVRALAARY